MERFYVLAALFFSVSSFAATKNVMVTGFWPPTNGMITRFSTNPSQNPEGWIGKNWNNSGYDFYAFFPIFKNGADNIGTGDFPVDYAAVFNDFLTFTRILDPVAIVSFGNAEQGWRIEKNFPNYWQNMFRSENLPSQIGESIQYPIPDALKQNILYHSTLPLENILAEVATVRRASPWINRYGNPGTFICGFTSYLNGWYHAEHSNPRDPHYNSMTGFIHTNLNLKIANQATLATLKAVIDALKADPNLGENK